MLLSIDDTDGPAGGCTTYVATLIADALGPSALAGPVRLVRLDPDNPWKTRGNAAVVLDLADDLDPHRVVSVAADVVREHARQAEGKGAGVAVLETPPAEAWYERGVTERVGPDEAARVLADAPTFTLGSGRGLVGCLCAAAWRPDETATYTRIVYREPERWGTAREVDEQAARRLAGEESVFDAWDPNDGHAAVAPRTPCPVLAGVRGTDPEALPKAARRVAGEPIHRTRTFVTNQASDDHLVPAALEPLTVLEGAQTLEGGHVRLPAKTPRGRTRTVMAYEPTGRLRDGLVAAEPGDRVLALGSLKRGGAQVNAEKLLLVSAEGALAPACPGCGASMASVGRASGYRCRRCGAREPGRSEEVQPTWYEADVSARRHLARPLALGLAESVRAAVDALDLEQAPVVAHEPSVPVRSEPPQ